MAPTGPRVTPEKKKPRLVQHILQGKVQQFELEAVAEKISIAWRTLCRRLEIPEYRIQAFDVEHRELKEKAYQGLLLWQAEKLEDSTYEVLYHALIKCGRKDMAEDFCTYEVLEEA